jgi:hypothetical protein
LIFVLVVVIIIIIIIITVLVLELGDLCLLGRPIPLELCPECFQFGYFEIGFCIHAWATLNHDPPIYASYPAGMAGMYYHT